MKKGFTLVEVMIVVIIVGILMAIAIPSFMKARQTALAKRNAELANATFPVLGSDYAIPPIKREESPLKISAMGACEVFTVYKVIDTTDKLITHSFYVVVSSNSPPQKISLEKSE